ncbi:hypothetical protein SRRS_27940 [Sporomusa rhizae]
MRSSSFYEKINASKTMRNGLYVIQNYIDFKIYISMYKTEKRLLT